MELCKAYYGLLLISLIYFQNEVRGKICKRSVESPFGSVREIHPGALTDKHPNKNDGMARYGDLYHPITETISGNAIRTKSAAFHQDIKVDSKCKLSRIARRHLNMAIKGEKKELMDLTNLKNQDLIPVKSKGGSISPSHNDASFTSHFKDAKLPYHHNSFSSKNRQMHMSTENVPESSTVMENNNEKRKNTLGVEKEIDSIQKSKNIFERDHVINYTKTTFKKMQKIDNKQSSLFGILFPRNPNRYLLKRKRDDSYYFLRLQNGDHERQQTLDPFWPRATKFRKRRPIVHPYNPFRIQNRITKMPAWTYFSDQERIPIRKSKNKPHFKMTTKFKGFAPSAQKKIPILIAYLSSNNISKISSKEYTENTESSFSINQALSKGNMSQENSEFTEADNSSPPDQTTAVGDTARTIPESTEVGSSLPGEQATDNTSAERSESTVADNNPPTDQTNESEDTYETKTESRKSKDSSSTDQSNSKANTYAENSESTETGNSLPRDQTIVVSDTSETNTESTEKKSNYSGKPTTDNSSAESSESTDADSSSADQSSVKENTFETKLESTESENSSSADQYNSKEKTLLEISEYTEASNSLTIDQITRARNTSKTNLESTETGNSSPRTLTDNISAESSESINANITRSTERIYRGYEANSSLTNQFNSKENKSAYNLKSTKTGNALPTNQTTRDGNTSQINPESIKVVNSFPGGLVADNTSTESLESIKAHTTEATERIYRGYEANSSLTVHSNDKENISAENSESKEDSNSLPTNQTIEIGNISETKPEPIEEGTSFPGKLVADNTFAESFKSMKSNTTEAIGLTYSGYGTNSSLTDQPNNKENISAENLKSTEAGNSLPTSQTTRVGSSSQTNPESINVGSSFPERLAADNTTAGSLEFIKTNTTQDTEKIYRGLKNNSSETDQSNSKGITSAKISKSTEAGNSSPANQTTRVGNASKMNPESVNTRSRFPVRLAADNTSVEDLESIKTNTGEATDRIYRGYRANSSRTNQSNNKGSIIENPDSTEAVKSLQTNQTVRVINMPETKPESITVVNIFPGRLVADNTSAKSFESIKSNTKESTERIYIGYGANNSLTDQPNNKENTSAENSESTEAGNSLPTNQTTTIVNASEKNVKLLEAGKSFPERLAVDNTSGKSSEFLKVNTTEYTEGIYRGYEANSSESKGAGNSSSSKERTFVESSVYIKAGNSTPEVGNISPAADNSSPSKDNSFLAADNSFAEASRRSPLEFNLHKSSPLEIYLHKNPLLSPDGSANPDKENLKFPNPQA